MAKHGAKTKTGKYSSHVLACPVRKLPREGSAAILRLLALTYLQDFRISKDREYGRQLLQAAGSDGDRTASRLLADYYHQGSHGFPLNKERSTYWWLRSERRQWSEQSPMYRYKLWRLSLSTGEDLSAII
jgi:TPR repeat protein